ADGQSREDLPAPQSQREQADGEGVVAEAVHVVGPEGEDAVRTPGPAGAGGGGQILVVEAGAEVVRVVGLQVVVGRGGRGEMGEVIAQGGHGGGPFCSGREQGGTAERERRLRQRGGRRFFSYCGKRFSERCVRDNTVGRFPVNGFPSGAAKWVAPDPVRTPLDSLPVRF